MVIITGNMLQVTRLNHMIFRPLDTDTEGARGIQTHKDKQSIQITLLEQRNDGLESSLVRLVKHPSSMNVWGRNV